MPLETATYISDLDPTNPVGSSDLVSSLDDHVRLVKATLQTTFPGIAGAVTATHTELNFLDGVTGTTGTGKLVLDGAPTIANLTVTGSITLPPGSVADAALSDNVPRKNVSNIFLGQRQTYQSDRPSLFFIETDASANTGRWELAAHNEQFVLNIYDDANQFLGLPFRILRSAAGTAELELNAPLLDFNGNADISGTLAVGGTITGNGSGLSSLNASNLSSGTVSSDRLPSTIGGNKTFSGDVTIGGAVRAGTIATSTSTTLAVGQVHAVAGNATLPNMAAGQWVGVVNNSASPITVTKNASDTMYWTASGSSVTSVTVAARGKATFFCADGTNVYASGNITGSS